MNTAVILIGLLVLAIVVVTVLLVLRQARTRRLGEHYAAENHDDQSDARAGAHASHLGRGGGFPL